MLIDELESCDISFTHAFNVLHSIFVVLILLEPINVYVHWKHTVMKKTYVITANVNGLLKMFYNFEQKIRPRPVHAFQLRACCPMSSKIKEVGKKRGKDIFASPSSLRTYYFTLLHKLDQFQMILTIIWAFDHLRLKPSHSLFLRYFSSLQQILAFYFGVKKEERELPIKMGLVPCIAVSTAYILLTMFLAEALRKIVKSALPVGLAR